MSLRKGLLIAQMAGKYKLYEGTITTDSASNTIEFPIKSGLKMFFFYILGFENYDPVENDMAVVGGAYRINFFPFVNSGENYLYSFYNGGTDYWTNGVFQYVNGNIFIVNNNRGVKTIPGAKYHYVEIYEP